MIKAIALLLLLAISSQATAVDAFELSMLEGDARREAVHEFLKQDLSKSPVEDLIGLLDSQFKLTQKQIDTIYFVVVDRIEGKSFQLLSEFSRSPDPTVAACALRLLGRTSNRDALQILVRKSKAENDIVAVAAISAMAHLSDKAANNHLENIARDLLRMLEQNDWYDHAVRPGAAAGALLIRGDSKYAPLWLDYIGMSWERFKMLAFRATRTTYNTASQIRLDRQAAESLKQQLQYIRHDLRNIMRAHPQQMVQHISKSNNGYTLDLVYDALPDVVDAQSAATWLLLLKSPSNPLKDLLLQLIRPIATDELRARIRQSLIDHSADTQSVPSRVFAVQHSDWFELADQQSLLEKCQADPSPWVRRIALRMTDQMASKTR